MHDEKLVRVGQVGIRINMKRSVQLCVCICMALPSEDEMQDAKEHGQPAAGESKY